MNIHIKMNRTAFKPFSPKLSNVNYINTENKVLVHLSSLDSFSTQTRVKPPLTISPRCLLLFYDIQGWTYNTWMERLWFLTLSDSRLIKAISSYFHNPLCEQHVTKSSQNTYNLWGNCTTVHKTIRGNKGHDSHHSFPLFCGLPKISCR